MSKKLDRFTAAILAEATEETERSMQEVQSHRDVSLARAEDKVLLEAYHYIHGEVARIKTEAGRRVSRHMLDNKRALYLRREEIACEVLDLVRQKITAFTQTADYGAQLTALYRQALKKLSGASDITIYLRPADSQYADLLKSAVPAVHPAFQAGLFQMGGLVAESRTLGLRVDSSFDSAAQSLSGRFAELFGLSLSDDES